MPRIELKTARIETKEWGARAASRRAIAKFHGLLSTGGNRKMGMSRAATVNAVTGTRPSIGKLYRRMRGINDLAWRKALIVCLFITLVLAITTVHATGALAQGAFPAPLPGRPAAAAPDPAFPPVNGSAPTTSLGAPPSSSFPVNGVAPVTGSAFERPPAAPSGAGADDCMKAFTPLREEAEKRGKLIKVASDKHAPPQEACKLIGNYGQAELKMIKYVEANAKKCGIPPQIADQLKAGHKNTDTMQKKVCDMAEQAAT